MAWHVLVLHPFYGCVETMRFLHVVMAAGYLDCSQLSATVRRCWALVSKYLLDFFPMFEHTPRSTLPSHAGLLFQVSSPLCKQTVISPLPLDPPFTLPNILPKVPTTLLSRQVCHNLMVSCLCVFKYAICCLKIQHGRSWLTHVCLTSGFRFQNLRLSHLILSGPCFYLFMFLSFFFKKDFRNKGKNEGNIHSAVLTQKSTSSINWMLSLLICFIVGT